MALTLPLALDADDARAADPLPQELGSVLLTLATSAVPIRLVSRLGEHLARALAGRRLPDADVVVLAAALTRAAGPWLPTRQRLTSVLRRIEQLLSRGGARPDDVQAVVADVEAAFTARVAMRPF